jgi:peptide/nickel transport system permease protein
MTQGELTPAVSRAELAESPAGPARRRPPEWLTTLKHSWSIGRTKVGVILFAAALALAVLGPLLAPHSPTEFVGQVFAAPSRRAPLGTDILGRDVLSRVLWGGRTVFAYALAATAVGMVIGTALGLYAAYASRWTDETIMRLLDVLLAFPSVVFVLLIVSLLGPQPWLIMLTVGLTHAPRVARVARGAALEVVDLDFVKASEAVGVPRVRILLAEILPNISSPIMVEGSLRLCYSVSIIAALSFLGFGLQPPAADWGLMINENRLGLAVQPYSVLVPALLIGVLTVGVSLIADGISRAMIGIQRTLGGQ